MVTLTMLDNKVPKFRCITASLGYGITYVYLFTAKLSEGGVSYEFDAYVDSTVKSPYGWCPKLYMQYHQGSFCEYFLEKLPMSGGFTGTGMNAIADYVKNNWWTVYQLLSSEAACHT